MFLRQPSPLLTFKGPILQAQIVTTIGYGTSPGVSMMCPQDRNLNSLRFVVVLLCVFFASFAGASRFSAKFELSDSNKGFVSNYKNGSRLIVPSFHSPNDYSELWMGTLVILSHIWIVSLKTSSTAVMFVKNRAGIVHLLPSGVEEKFEGQYDLKAVCILELPEGISTQQRQEVISNCHSSLVKDFTDNLDLVATFQINVVVCKISYEPVVESVCADNSSLEKLTDQDLNNDPLTSIHDFGDHFVELLPDFPPFTNHLFADEHSPNQNNLERDTGHVKLGTSPFISSVGDTNEHAIDNPQRNTFPEQSAKGRSGMVQEISWIDSAVLQPQSSESRIGDQRHRAGSRNKNEEYLSHETLEKTLVMSLIPAKGHVNHRGPFTVFKYRKLIRQFTVIDPKNDQAYQFADYDLRTCNFEELCHHASLCKAFWARPLVRNDKVIFENREYWVKMRSDNGEYRLKPVTAGKIISVANRESIKLLK